MTHTKRIDKEMVLDFIYISVSRSVIEESRVCETIQEVHLLNDRNAVMDCFQYPMSSGGGFSELNGEVGVRITCLPHHSPTVVFSLFGML